MTTDPTRPRPAAGTARVLGSEEFSVSAAVGGPRGIAESVLPTLVFVVLFAITRDLVLAAGAAVGMCLVLVLARVVQRQSIASALGGLLGVAIGAVWSLFSGSSSDFYLPGLLINAAAACVLLVSVAARMPLVGFLAAAVDPVVARWRDVPAARRGYGRATVLFAGLYLLKLAVQLPLFLAGRTDALGVAKLAMGLPLFAVVAWLVWLMHRAIAAGMRRESTPAAG